MKTAIACSRWIVSHATSSHPDFGPDLVAVCVNERIVALLRDFFQSLDDMVAKGRAMSRLQWMGAHVEFLRADENECETGCLAGLEDEKAIMLPPCADLPQSCLYDREFRSECDSLTLVRVSEFFDPEVFATARIKYTGIEVDSKVDLWPLIEEAFPDKAISAG